MSAAGSRPPRSRGALARALAGGGLLVAFSACAVGRQQAAVGARLAEERKEQEAARRADYNLRLTCPENSERFLGEAQLQPPSFGFQVTAGKRYPLVLRTVEGKMYRGEIRALDPGSYGQYPGYDVCVDKSFLKQIDEGGGAIRFTVTSPKGERVLEVTLGR